MYDPNNPDFNDYYNDPFFSNNTFRYQTGGASPALRGTAAQLTQANYGTQSANAFRDAMMRSAQQQQRTAQSAMYAGGGAGNYGAMAGLANQLGNNVNNQAQKAYAQGAQTNLAGVEAGGRLFGQADTLDNEAKKASLDYISRFRPEYDPGAVMREQQAYQSENFLPGLLKGLGSGLLGGLTGGLTGFLTDKLFSVIPNLNENPRTPQTPLVAPDAAPPNNQPIRYNSSNPNTDWQSQYLAQLLSKSAWNNF